MEVVRIAPGLWRWTGYHPKWKKDVGCVYCETRDGVVLIDPLVPKEDTERFWGALDSDVERAGAVVHVLITVFWHTRSAGEIADRYTARVWAPTMSRAAVERRGGAVTDPFRPGDPLPGGIQAFPTARTSEVVFWIPEHGALVPGDVLLGDRPGGIRMCPSSWLPEHVGHAELAASLRPLLDLPVEGVLVSHGEPLLEDAAATLAAALTVQ